MLAQVVSPIHLPVSLWINAKSALLPPSRRLTECHGAISANASPSSFAPHLFPFRKRGHALWVCLGSSLLDLQRWANVRPSVLGFPQFMLHAPVALDVPYAPHTIAIDQIACQERHADRHGPPYLQSMQGPQHRCSLV